PGNLTGAARAPGPEPATASSTAPAPGQDAERRRIMEALEQCAGNQTRAAKLLGISLRTLVNRLAQHGLPRPRRRS
ncbi:MAG TPA: helix-turn-helix domain-containing protein, partial [Kofleriaceae bacterium]|nr:helix-turn-helix domain-containing protein [Kofleriaceae bacterium]